MRGHTIFLQLPALVLAAILTTLGSPLVAQRSATAGSLWSATEVSSTTLSAATEDLGTIRVRYAPTAGNVLLEVRALLAVRADSVPGVPSERVFLVMRPGQGPLRRIELVALGVVGRSGSCSWTDPNALKQGGMTVTAESGDGVGMRRDTWEGPLVITLQRNPSRTCFLFPVPDDPRATFRLRFADASVSVPRS